MIIWNVILALIAALSWRGNVHFGLGIADFLIFSLIILVIIIMNTAYILSFRLKSFLYGKEKAILISCGLFLVWLLMQMTFLRGAASPWNGKIFF